MTDLERIARLLCQADGYDPDLLVLPYPPMIGPRGFYVINAGHLTPSWQFYQHYVQGTLDAILTGAQDGDLKTIIDHVLSGEQIPIEIDENSIEIVEAPPSPAPDWRYRYNLQSL